MISKISYKQNMATLWHRPSNGVYYAVWEENGKTRRLSLRTTDEIKAQRHYRNFERNLMAGKVKPIAEGSRKLFFDFCTEYLEHIEATIAPATYDLYSIALEKAKAVWGDIPLNHITARHIDKLIEDMSRAGLKPPTINKNIRGIKAALKKAYAWEYIKTPIREFPKQLKEEKTLRYLSIEQLGSLISAIENDQEFADFCLFSAYTALRSGEIIRLQWADVDTPEGFLRISSRQKNKQDSRIPINAHARAILERRGLSKKKIGKVFRFGCLTWVSQKCKAACIKAGLPGARFHDLRHTFASHLAMSGENLKTIQDLMRHESIASTMIYAKVSPEHLRKASESVNYGPMPLCQTAGSPTKSRPSIED